VIDATTIIGSKKRAGEKHTVHVQVHDESAPLKNVIPQKDFWQNPRYTFNLHLDKKARIIVERLNGYPKLGDCF